MPFERDRESRELELVERSCPTCGSDAAVVVARGRDYEYSTCSNEFAFQQCSDCMTVYLNPRPRRRDFDIIYPPTYYASTEARGQGGAGKIIRAAWEEVERRRTSFLVELLGSREARVLDVGCGDGRLLRVLRGINREWSLTGIELSPPTALIDDSARLGITIVSGSYEDLVLDAEAYDLITAQQMIEHAVDPEAVLEKMRSELSTGGFAVLDTPNVEGIDRKIFARSLWGGYHFPRHMTLFSPQTISDLARRQGFDVVKIVPLLSPVFWIMSLHNLAVKGRLPERITSSITYQNLPLLTLTTLVELSNRGVLQRTSNMRVILRKGPPRV